MREPRWLVVGGEANEYISEARRIESDLNGAEEANGHDKFLATQRVTSAAFTGNVDAAESLKAPNYFQI